MRDNMERPPEMKSLRLGDRPDAARNLRFLNVRDDAATAVRFVLVTDKSL